MNRSLRRQAAGWLAVFAVVALVYGVWPTLDLRLADALHDPSSGFIGRDWGWVLASYHAVPWFGRLLLLGVLLCLWGPRTVRLVSPRARRAATGLLVALLVGLTLVVNLTLKETWGRARPHQVSEFGGSRQYTPPLQPASQCQRNCSFTSGHAATGFALIGAGALAGARRRRHWWLLGTAAGAIIGAGRMLQGDHFLGDVLFSWLILWALAWLLRLVWLHLALRRRAPRLRQDNAT